MFESKKVRSIMKIIMVLFFIIGLLSKYAIKNEILDNISFIIVGICFIFFIMAEKKES